MRSSPDRLSCQRLRAGAIPESILSDSRDLRRHFRVAQWRNLHCASPDAAVDFAVLAFSGRDEADNQQNQED